MTRQSFIAFVHAAEHTEAAAAVARQLGDFQMKRIPIDDGVLTLGLKDSNAHGSRSPELLAVVDGTAGAPAMSFRAGCANLDPVPAHLRGLISQFRSYLWLDSRQRPVFLTDHMGVSPVYTVALPGLRAFSSDHGLLSALVPRIDHGMIASFLVNGRMLQDRTLHEGVASLPLASISVAANGGIETEPYWRFRPGADTSSDTAAVERELWSRITGAVLDSAAGRHVMLPLSGGHDSSCIAGILHAAGHPFSSFSFGTGEPAPNSDADLGRRQAEALGIPHRFYGMEPRDTLSLLRSNIDNGMRLRSICQEIEVYGRAAEDARATLTNPMFLFGDQSFGQRTFRLDTGDDLLAAGGLRTPALLDRYNSLLAAPGIAALRPMLDAAYSDVLETVRAVPGTADDHKDWLYYASALSADLVRMRAHCGAPFLPSAMPFLELSILDFLKHLHVGERRDKRLFKRVSERALPSIFSIPRSLSRQSELDLASMLRRDAPAIRSLLATLSPRVPDLSLQGGLAAMFEAEIVAAPGTHTPNTTRDMAETALRWIVRRRIIPERWLVPVKRRIWSKFEVIPGIPSLFLRAVQLAMVFDGLPLQVVLPPEFVGPRQGAAVPGCPPAT
jgi:hypothetical protein